MGLHQTEDNLQQFTATITNHREVAHNLVWVGLRAPAAALREAKAGQFVFVRCGAADSFDPYLRRPFSLAAFDVDGESAALLVRVSGRGSRWLTERVEGEQLDMIGPLGNGYRLDERSRHLLAIVGGERQPHLAPLLPLLKSAAARELSVTLLIEAEREAYLPPASLLPPEVEYQTFFREAGDSAIAHIKPLLGWADQVVAAGPDDFLAALKKVAGAVYPRPDIQASVERPMACAVGVCLGCAVENERVGYLRACREGPVFDLWKMVL